MATEERFTSLYKGEFICNLSVLEIEIVQQKLIFCYAPSSKGGCSNIRLEKNLKSPELAPHLYITF
jgi:hypothetical protein